MQFAEDFLTNKKRRTSTQTSINSSLVRVLGIINSKGGQTVKVVQRWDDQRPSISYLLSDFNRWPINEKLEQPSQLGILSQVRNS